jgi:hypothetical protein
VAPGRPTAGTVLALTGLIVVGMLATTWASALTRTWEAQLTQRAAFALPRDLWSTLAAASRLLHLDIGGLYTQPTALISFPGTALIQVPVVALIRAAGFGLAPPDAANPHPGAWLLAGPYAMALSGLALFAADASCERGPVAKPGADGVAQAGTTLPFGMVFFSDDSKAQYRLRQYPEKF